jgi:hypothetical protein
MKMRSDQNRDLGFLQRSGGQLTLLVVAVVVLLIFAWSYF